MGGFDERISSGAIVDMVAIWDEGLVRWMLWVESLRTDLVKGQSGTEISGEDEDLQCVVRRGS